MDRVFVDTSGWLAYVNRKDPDHQAVRKALRDYDGRLVTSNYVFDEVVTLCRYRLDHRAAIRVGTVLRDVDAVDLVTITPDDEQSAWELFQSRGDQAYSFTDCTSFVLMRRLGIAVAVAADDDFEHEGFQVLPCA